MASYFLICFLFFVFYSKALQSVLLTVEEAKMMNPVSSHQAINNMGNVDEVMIVEGNQSLD